MARADDKHWIEQEYARLMGTEALQRQRRAAIEEARQRKEGCNCSARVGHGKLPANQPGYHHDATCNLYPRTRETT